MILLKVTIVQILEVDALGDLSVVDFSDSLMDHLLDEQGSTCETSDSKFSYTPSDIVTLKVEPYAETEND